MIFTNTSVLPADIERVAFRRLNDLPHDLPPLPASRRPSFLHAAWYMKVAVCVLAVHRRTCLMNIRGRFWPPVQSVTAYDMRQRCAMVA